MASQSLLLHKHCKLALKVPQNNIKSQAPWMASGHKPKNGALQKTQRNTHLGGLGWRKRKPKTMLINGLGANGWQGHRKTKTATAICKAMPCLGGK